MKAINEFKSYSFLKRTLQVIVISSYNGLIIDANFDNDFFANIHMHDKYNSHVKRPDTSRTLLGKGTSFSFHLGLALYTYLIKKY